MDDRSLGPELQVCLPKEGGSDHNQTCLALIPLMHMTADSRVHVQSIVWQVTGLVCT